MLFICGKASSLTFLLFKVVVLYIFQTNCITNLSNTPEKLIGTSIRIALNLQINLKKSF